MGFISTTYAKNKSEAYLLIARIYTLVCKSELTAGGKIDSRVVH
jgi:hypothetical protein